MQDIVREMQKGIILWYDFPSESAILYDGTEDDAVYEALTEQGLSVDIMSESNEPIYDYVVSIGVPETLEDSESHIKLYRKCLKPDGKLLLAMNNRMGIRYFCGDRDPYTGRNFDGVDNYRDAYGRKGDVFKGRCFNECELRDMVADAGFNNSTFFSCLSDLNETTLIIREDYLPKEDLSTRVFPAYEYPKTVFLREERMYADLIKNGLFHKLSNAFFIECYNDGKCSDVLQVTFSLARGKENAMVTIVRDNGTAEKRCVYKEGERRLQDIVSNLNELRENGVPVIDANAEDSSIIMPYIGAPIGQVYLKELFTRDVEEFLVAMDTFRDAILSSSEHVEEDTEDGVILKKAYIDMVPLNTFYVDDEFVFFDQEFSVENYPANAIISRMVWTFYERNPECNAIYPMDKVLDRYGLLDDKMRWRKMDDEFFKDILTRSDLSEYRRKHWQDGAAIDTNRLRMNYDADNYQRIFVDIFEGLDDKRLVLFGSGNYAKRFIELYGVDYNIEAIIDNSPEKQGQEIEGIPICSAGYFDEKNPDEYKVLVCIKRYTSIIDQLEEMGIKDYAIYDAGHNYPRKRNPISIPSETNESDEKKKYHIGYVAGVFDLFHQGHLNLIRKAKEQCDYLIVGVVSDSGVARDKEKKTVVPLEERKEIVASCRYVDEVVEVPFNYSSVQDTYNLYKYDVQFSGDDHKDDPAWLEAKAYLNEHGSDIVFFPYTEKVSTTIRKELIK